MRPVPEFDPRSWLLKAMRETSHAMESLLWDLDDDALDRPGFGDEWSCADLVFHMMEMERRYIDWLERIARVEDPKLGAFDGDTIGPRDRDDDVTTVFDMMDEFSVLRRQTVYLLWSLDEDDWDRGGMHPYLGRRTILDIAREMNEHDLSHLWQLRRICDAFSAATV